MAKLLRIDITNNITAKFKDEYLELYTSKFFIGKYYFHRKRKVTELLEGYLYDDGKFYKEINIKNRFEE